MKAVGFFVILRKFLCIPSPLKISLRVKLIINPCLCAVFSLLMKLFESMYIAESCSFIPYKSSMHECNWSHAISQLKQVGLLKEEVPVISGLNESNFLTTPIK